MLCLCNKPGIDTSKHNFVIGSTNYRKSTLDTHATTSAHTLAQSASDNLNMSSTSDDKSSPATQALMTLKESKRRGLEKSFLTYML